MFNNHRKDTTMTPSTTTTTPDETEWHVHEEYRVRSVFVRMLRSDDYERVKLIIANSPEGLDQPDALTVERFWDLHCALRAAGLIAEMVGSASLSEERHANSEMARLGVTDFDCVEPDPADLQAPDDVESSSESPSGDGMPEATEGFTVAGLSGFVEAGRDDHRVFLANSRYDLDETHRCLRVRSANGLRQALEAACVMVEIARGDQGVKALCYQHLTRLGASTFDLPVLPRTDDK